MSWDPQHLRWLLPLLLDCTERSFAITEAGRRVWQPLLCPWFPGRARGRIEQCLDNQPKMSLPFCHPSFFPMQLWDLSLYEGKNPRVRRRAVILPSWGCPGHPAEPNPCPYRETAHYWWSPIQSSAGRHPEGDITESLFFVSCLNISLQKEIMAWRM